MGIFSTIIELYGAIAVIYLIALLVIAFQPTGHITTQTILSDIVQALLWPMEAYRYFSGK